MEDKKQNKQQEKKSLHVEVVRQMLSLATSGFGLVAALAWNSVIQDFVNNYIKKFLPVGSGTLSLLIYAVIITFLAVFVTYQLSKILNRLSPADKT
jgi:hypothetical protein